MCCRSTVLLHKKKRSSSTCNSERHLNVLKMSIFVEHLHWQLPVRQLIEFVKFILIALYMQFLIKWNANIKVYKRSGPHYPPSRLPFTTRSHVQFICWRIQELILMLNCLILRANTISIHVNTTKSSFVNNRSYLIQFPFILFHCIDSQNKRNSIRIRNFMKCLQY